MKNLKKYFRILAKKFAENLNRELTHILNHPNILDYKNVSFEPHSRAEYENKKSSSFYHLDCNHEDAESEEKMMPPYHSNFISTSRSINYLKNINKNVSPFVLAC